MSTATPLVFRPSLVHRTLAALLCVGSCLAGIRVVTLLVQHLPRLYGAIQMAKVQSEPTWSQWLVLCAGILACAVGGILLLMAILALLLIEGSQVLVDDMGIAVEHNALPGPLARRFGAGRIAWKQVSGVEKRRFFFVIHAEGEKDAQGRSAPMVSCVRFLVVDQLERLIFLIFERSPQLREPRSSTERM